MLGEGNEDKNTPRENAKGETANQGGGSDPPLPPVIWPPNSPPHPPSSAAAYQEPHERRENAKLILEVIGVVLLLVYTVFTALQWTQIRWTNRQTAQALEGSGDALSQTLIKMQGQIDAAGRQADRTKELADKMGDSVKQATRLAKATEEANRNVLQADRPWFGAVLTVEGFEKDKVPAATIYFTNSGKRPARILVAEAHTGWFSTFPNKPPYEPLGNVSRGVVVPGTPLINRFNMAKSPLSELEISTASNGSPASYFLYANLEYIDMRMGQHHYAHFCWRYIGNTPQLPKGFYGCEGYDDAD